MAVAWTEKRVAELRALHEQGLSRSQIARQLGGGLTKNAVTGKCDRLGLHHVQPKASVCTPTKRPANTLVFGAGSHELKPASVLPLDTIPADAVPLLALTRGQCRWPFTGASETLFCGHQRAEGSYCAHHVRWSQQATVQAMRSGQSSNCQRSESGMRMVA